MEIGFESFVAWFEKNQKELLYKARNWKVNNDLLKSQFLEEWPLDRLKNMTVDEYVTGKGSENKSFCYEIEHGAFSEMYLRIKGGGASKFGMYWNKDTQTYVDQGNKRIPENDVTNRFNILKNDLVEIITTIIERKDDSSFEYIELKDNSFYSRPAIIMKLVCAYSDVPVFSGINMKKDQKEVWNKLVMKNKFRGVFGQNFDITRKINDEIPELDGDLLSTILWEYREFVIQNEGEDSMPETKQNTLKKDGFSEKLLSSKNIILRGAPGTGKTYLAHQMVANVVSNGRTDSIEELTNDENLQWEFVQFHPSYDYTDFVEGLRPANSLNGLGFELTSGIFKSFCERAKAAPNPEVDNFENVWNKFINEMDEHEEIEIAKGYVYYPSESWETSGGIVRISEKGYKQYINKDQLYKVYRGLPGVPKSGHDNFRKKVLQYMQENLGLLPYKESESVNNKKYIFIIDEINRGEISKIFGELFFSIDPGYRGKKGRVATQYSNLHDDIEEKFYVPENVYILGTMNDIDRSVDTFDFAMRRRFNFIEVTAEQSGEKMLQHIQTKAVMNRLNAALIDDSIGELTSDYQIGASYYLDIDDKNITMRQLLWLWDTKLSPLIMDYFRGDYRSTEKMDRLKNIFMGTNEEN